MFSNKVSIKTLAVLCRSLGTMLNSGVAVTKSLDMLANKTMQPRTHTALVEVGRMVRSGSDLTEAFRAQHHFPELFLDMVNVAEQSGSLPEVLRGLAVHYEKNIRVRNEFLGSIAWPVIQLFAAIFVIALAILVMGFVASMNIQQGQEPIDMLGLGLRGESGAVIWLGTCFGTLFVGFIVFQTLRSSLAASRHFDGLLMRIPVVGNCLRSFAISRFSWAYALTQQTGMSVQKSIEASFRATNNGAFAAAIPDVNAAVTNGDDLSEALRWSGLFPEDFLQIIMVAEESGTVPEQLERLSPDFDDQARRSLKVLTTTASFVIWGAVATLIVYMIFKIFSQYIGMLNEVIKAT